MYGQQPIFYPNPAMQNAQQRLQMMENQYPQYANPPMGYTPPSPYGQNPQPAAAPVLKGRPVSNEEEANAAMIDFDGSLFIFPDKAHGRIYTKQLGLDGNPIFERYVRETAVQTSEVPTAISSVEYVKKEDFEQQIAALQSYVQELEQKISSPSQTKGGSK